MMAWSHCLTDLLLMILDKLDYEAILSCTKVSSHWRDVARQHPTFWKRLHISDATLTGGGVAMFLERLGALGPRTVTSTIQVSLRFSMAHDQLEHSILPALLNNMYRIECLSLVVTPVVAQLFRSIFEVPAPKLESLHIYLRYLGSDTWTMLDDFPAMFHLHRNDALTNVTLVDVPLPNNLPPLQHVVKTVTVHYIHVFPQLGRVIAWIPHIQSLDLWSVRPVSYRPGKLATEAVAHSQGLGPQLSQISLYCTDWHTVLQSLETRKHLPLVVLRIRRPNPEETATLLPQKGLLRARIGIRHSHPRWKPGAGPWGVLAVASEDLSLVRVFEQLSIDHMLSTRFTQPMLPADRISNLIVSLSMGFIQLCSAGRHFPVVETLRVCLNRLPEPPERWTHGKVVCPRLRTISFQRECETQPGVVTRRAVDSFIEHALDLPTSTTLYVTLTDLRMIGHKGQQKGSRISVIRHGSIGPCATGLGGMENVL